MFVKNLLVGLLLLTGQLLHVPATTLVAAQQPQCPVNPNSFAVCATAAQDQLVAEPTDDQLLLQSLQAIVPLPEEMTQKLVVSEMQTQHPKAVAHHDPCPLFDAYPDLQKTVPHMDLIDAPTPVEKMSKIGTVIGLPSLYVKRDDLTGKVMKNGKRAYGGNKPRKLCYLLPYGLELGTNAATAWGCAGSNFAVAATWYARELGLKPILFLRPQPNSRVVQKNLKLMQALGAEMHYCSDKKVRAISTAQAALKNRMENGHFPLCMPTGGSNARGAIGFVNAMFELQGQIKAGLLPEPDFIVVPSGSCGTAAGMLVGIRALGLKSKVIAVVTEPADRAEFAGDLAKLATETSALLHQSDSKFPAMTFNPSELFVVTEFGGDDYGLFSKEGVVAAKLALDLQGLKLDGTYTGKAFAGLLGVQAQLPRNSTVLYWHTYCADQHEDITANADYTKMPAELQKFFTEPVQPLDK